MKSESPLKMKTKLCWISCGFLAALSWSSALRAETPDYQIEASFGAGGLKSPALTLAVDATDQLHALLAGGTVVVFDSAGKEVSSFTAEMTPVPTTMTLANGRIYLLATSSRQEEIESQGRKRKVTVPTGVKCGVFSPTGTKESEFDLPEVVSATDVHFIDGKLAVGDLRKSQIVMFDLTGEKPKAGKVIDKMFRLCCGIFDFCPTLDGKSLLVANLGAFKVQTFTNGRKSDEFGARGESLDEFHGCCNPVNVADLGEEALITVEKSPTRVKICSRKGKAPKTIPGLGELVKGCSTIPIAVDGKGAIYLASASRRCIVKCVSAGGAAPTPTAAAPTANAGPAELSEVRDWQDEKGRIVKGKLIAFEGAGTGTEKQPEVVRDGKVRLLVNRKTYDLPLNRLVAGDQEFVAKLVADLARQAESPP